MIKLYQFPSIWGLPNASPFCMKLETYLRMAKLPFEKVIVHDPRKSLKGKLPCISDDGKKMADSGFIIEYLQHKYSDTSDSHLTEEQKASVLTLRRMLEEHLYWVIVYSRWIDERYWSIAKEAFFGHLKGPLYYLIPRLVRKNLRSVLYKQGIGRHSVEEVYQLGIEDLHALSIVLEQHSFCMGDEPTSIDACVYAFLANILQPPLPSPLQDYAKAQKHFLTYCERMKERFYS
jgi:glutathione S-transferase